MEYVTLNNGIKMPKLGYGVYQTPPEDTKRCVLDAIDVGYRSIDTAQAYYNEEGVGAALAECGLPREEFFLTTKVWITNAGYEKAKASIEESMRKLRTDYLDLLLIHQPFGDYYGTYRAMEELYKAGKLRAIGVSNFGPDRYLDIQHFAEIKPADRVLGALCRGPQGYVYQPCAGGDRQKVRQDRRPDRPAVPASERCGHHPQVCSQGAHAPELRPV